MQTSRPLLGLMYEPFRVKFCADEATTLEFAAEFMAGLEPPALIALTGDLGAGKTTFVRGMAKSLGLADQVHSPTYALKHEYGNPVRLQHLDLYRLGDGADLAELGIEASETDLEAEPCITCVEWPERMPIGTAFEHWFHLTLDENQPEGRTITWYQRKISSTESR